MRLGTHRKERKKGRPVTAGNGPLNNMSTSDLIAQSASGATKRKRSYPIARIFDNGSVSVRIAPGTWTEALTALPVPLFELLPQWQQRQIAERAIGVKRGHILLAQPE